MADKTAAEHLPPKKQQTRRLRPMPDWVKVDPNRRIDVHELAALSGAGGISTVYDWIRAGVLPPGDKLTPSSTRWRYGDVIAALDKLSGQEVA